jgi:hypothetical protein
VTVPAYYSGAKSGWKRSINLRKTFLDEPQSV